MSRQFDVIIIGGGPAGYPAAIRAAQLGMKVACIETRTRLGGTCLNIGCIPSKALLESTEQYVHALHGMDRHGVEIGEVKLNLGKLLGHKDRVVADLGNGVEFLLRKNKVARFLGRGRITGKNKVEVTSDGAPPVTLEAPTIVIATGSDVTPLPGAEIDEARIVSSTGALSLPQVPRRLAIVGGGYIGLELGSVWQRLGSEVTVIEYLDRVAPGLDSEMAGELQKVLTSNGFRFLLQTKVKRVALDDQGVTLAVESSSGGETSEMEADVVLVSIGRRAFTEGLGLDEIGVLRNGKGFIKVDKGFATNVPGVYAVGDVIGGAMLAHKATEEGIALMEQLAGQRPHINYGAIPSIVYTSPEVAMVGATEEELKAAGVDYRAGRFPFTANARARAKADMRGLVKVLADARTDQILGVHIIGPEAGTMIHEAVVAIEFKASAEDIARCCHAHPTLPEAIKEAALAVDGRALHV